MRTQNTNVRLVPLWLLLLLTLLAISTPSHAEFHRQFQLEGQRLVLANLLGKVEITATDGNEFVIEAFVRGKDASEEMLQFETEEDARESHFVLRYPVDRHHDYVYPPMGKRSTSQFRYGPDHDGNHSFLRQLFGGNGEKITVRGTGKGLEIWADLKIGVPSGKKCEIYLGCGGINAMDLSADLSLSTHSGQITANGMKGKLDTESGSGRIEISAVEGEVEVDTGSGSVVASDIDGELSIDTGSGSLRLRSVKGAKVEADTGSGSISAEDLQCEDLSLETGSGSVDGKNLNCEEVEIGTGSGSIDLKGVGTDSAEIETGSGNIKLQLDRMGSGVFTLEAGSGRIEFTLPARASARIAAESSSGTVRIEREGVTVEKKDKHSVQILVGGGEAQVSLETGSGGISIR